MYPLYVCLESWSVIRSFECCCWRWRVDERGSIYRERDDVSVGVTCLKYDAIDVTPRPRRVHPTGSR